jgi:hypothetical protein
VRVFVAFAVGRVTHGVRVPAEVSLCHLVSLLQERVVVVASGWLAWGSGHGCMSRRLVYWRATQQGGAGAGLRTFGSSSWLFDVASPGQPASNRFV